MKINVATDKIKQPKWNVTLKIDEIGVAVQSWLQVQVKFMAW